MSAALDPLVMDLVAFVATGPRPYDEVMDAWRTSCPRLTVREDAVDAGLVVRRGPEVVELTAKGRDLVRSHG